MAKECCPRFDPAPWDGKITEWKGKRFVKGKVLTLFHMPINFASVITKMMAKVDEAGASVPEGLCLSDHTSRWNMDLYLAVDKEVPGLEEATLSGRYLSKVYEGPFSDTGKWMKDSDAYLDSRGEKARKTYMWYTTCPGCAKKYGKNYVVVVSELA